MIKMCVFVSYEKQNEKWRCYFKEDLASLCPLELSKTLGKRCILAVQFTQHTIRLTKPGSAEHMGLVGICDHLLCADT